MMIIGLIEAAWFRAGRTLSVQSVVSCSEPKGKSPLAGLSAKHGRAPKLGIAVETNTVWRKELNKRLLAVLLAGAASSARALPSYTIFDLGTLGGTDSSGRSVNDSGQVTGTASIAGTNASHAFVGDDNGLTDLGTFGGTYSHGFGINSSGQVTGYSSTFGSSVYHAFIGDSGGVTDLGTLGGSYSYGYSINDGGQVVGRSYVAGNSASHVFMGDAGGLIDLGTLGGTSGTGLGINNSGQVTGYSFVAGNGATHAFVGNENGLTDLGTLGGTNSWSQGINESGLVAGYSSITGDSGYHAFVGNENGLTDLGTLGGTSSWGHGINDSGLVVGYSHITGNSGTHAFLWDFTDGMLDLNDLVVDLTGWNYLYQALDISNNGYITGIGITSAGRQHAYVLALEDGPAPSGNTPEPTTIGLLGFGMAGISMLRRRRRVIR